MDSHFLQPEHLHVMLNHFPIILTLIVPPILLAGLFFQQKPILAVGFSLALLGALITPVVMQTGHSAHTRFEMGQIQPPLDEDGDIASEMHLDMAEKAAPILYFVGFGGIAGLLILRFRPAWAKGAALAVIVAAGVASIFTLQSAQLGGRIRHPEFRPQKNPTPNHIRND
ncbi:MAG: hypothetical protein O2804_02750 [Verrucomicrobia bacterium]|nr:hypothetical protein [Verrucomicrobiota bacterium]